jgi:type IV secretory pathway VirB4 component
MAGKAEALADKLLETVEQFSLPELEKFVDKVLALRARRVAPVLTHEESDLLLTINHGLPPDEQTRFDKLIKKQRQSSLTKAEREELLRLVDEIENMDASRAEALGKLAALRGVSLHELMNQLGIKPRPVL